MYVFAGKAVWGFIEGRTQDKIDWTTNELLRFPCRFQQLGGRVRR